MSQNVLDDVLEVLNNIFDKCDVDQTGLVDINTIISNLTPQDPSWQGDERIEEEVRKLLLCSESSHLISKDHFINSLLHYFESNYCQGNETNEESSSDDMGEKCSSSSSGVGDSLETISTSSTNSTGGNVPVHFNGVTYAVSSMREFLTTPIQGLEHGINTTEHSSSPQGDITNKDGDILSDELSVTDSESPRANTKLRESLEKELNSLQKKHEYLEAANNSLLAQISSLEEVVARIKKESATYFKKLTESNQLAKTYKQKQQEAEEKLYVCIEENKFGSKKLLQSSRENSKLKNSISQLEKQVDVISVKQIQKDAKIKELQERLKLLSDLHTESQEELECLKIKEKALLEDLEKLTEQNSNLQCQLESSIILVQGVKSELTSAYRELSTLQNAKITNRLQPENLPDNLSDDNSLVFFDGDFTLDNTIPFETSLMAEIQDTVLDKDQPTPRKCCCICAKNLSFSSSSSISVGTDNYTTADATVGTERTELTDNATMTTFTDVSEFEASKQVLHKDVGVNCSLKNIVEENFLELNCKLSHLKSKRSLTKWMILGSILLLLCFLLAFISSLATLSYAIKHSPDGTCCLSSCFDLFLKPKKYPDLQKPIY